MRRGLSDKMASLSRLSLNQYTVRPQWSLQQAIEGCSRHGVQAIGVWRDKLAEMGVAKARRRLATEGLVVTSLCAAGWFTAADEAGRRRSLDENRRALDEAAELAAECLVVIGGGVPNGSLGLLEARSQARDGLAALLDEARSRGVVIGLEPLHPMFAADRGCITTLREANDLCDSLGDGIGVVVDAYHCWWDPSIDEEIARAKGRIVGFHVNDWLNPTKDLRLDRGMMGDGVIDIPAIRKSIEASSYAGFIEVEIFSQENWWKRDADEVVSVVKDRFIQTV